MKPRPQIPIEAPCGNRQIPPDICHTEFPEVHEPGKRSFMDEDVGDAVITMADDQFFVPGPRSHQMLQSLLCSKMFEFIVEMFLWINQTRLQPGACVLQRRIQTEIEEASLHWSLMEASQGMGKEFHEPRCIGLQGGMRSIQSWKPLSQQPLRSTGCSLGQDFRNGQEGFCPTHACCFVYDAGIPTSLHHLEESRLSTWTGESAGDGLGEAVPGYLDVPIRVFFFYFGRNLQSKCRMQAVIF